MSTIKPLRQLLALRRRQQERYETEVREQTKRTRAAEHEAEAARTEEAACAQREQLTVSRRKQLTERSFAPADLITADFGVKAAQAVTLAATADCTRADATLRAENGALQASRLQASRNLKRIEDVGLRLAKVLRERDEREEDADAEESEETAGARIAKRRAVSEEARGA
jgi:Bacterial type III secretion protein (HrpB7)